MTTKETVAFRLQQPLLERVQEYAEERGISQSDALRELVQEGLDPDELRQEIEELNEQLDELRQIRDRVEQIEERLDQPFWQRWW